MADAIHLKLAGIKGESLHARHRDEIAVESWNWGVAVAAAAGGSGAGSAVGRPNFAPFSFTHRVDIASPLLWKACTTGSSIADGVLSIARPLASGGDYLTLRMTGLVVTAVNLADASVDNTPPLESVSLLCRTFEYSYRPQLANGSLGPEVAFRYDIVAGRVL